MIEGTLQNNTQPTQKVLKMIKNERMGGYVPSWVTPKTAQEQINTDLSHASNAQNTPNFKNALALQSNETNYESHHTEEFGFGDLVDMVNPLHHIPLVGTIYREITGDEIKPIGKIIGGGVFGGGVGAASGLVNAVIEAETGKDLTGNAVSMVIDGEKPVFKSTSVSSPEEELSNAINQAENTNKLHPSLMAFTDTNNRFKSFNLERIQDADNMADMLPPREPITKVHIEQKVPFQEL